MAIAALVCLAGTPDGQLSSRALAQEIGSHEVTLRRLLSTLRYAGLVEGRAGRAGGWAVARDPSLIGLGELHRALRGAAIAPTRSRVDRLLAEAEEAFAVRLDRVTVADLAREAASRDRDS